MKKWIKLFTAIVATSMIFTGCSTTNSKDGKTSEATQQVNPAQNRKESKDTLIVAVGEFAGAFLPCFQDSASDGTPASLMFSGLIKYDASGKPIPELAEKWEVSSEGLTYKVTLKDGVKFWDGKPITTQDIEFTFLTLADPEYDGWHDDGVKNLVGYAEYKNDKDNKVNKIKGIEIVDAKNIKVTFKDKFRTNVDLLSTLIMPKHVYDKGKGKIKEMRDLMDKEVYVGSGPYKMTKYEKKQYVEMERNDSYFKGAPKIKKLILKNVPRTSIASELQVGDIDVATGYPAKAEDLALIKDFNFLERKIDKPGSFNYIGLRVDRPGLNEKEVRQALAYAFDAPGFIKLYYGDYGVPMCQPIVDQSFAYSQDYINKINKYSYDIKKANKILDDAGWVKGADGIRQKNGVKLEFRNLAYSNSKYVTTLIPLLQSQWQQIGVKVNTEIFDWGVFTKMTNGDSNENFDTFVTGWNYGTDPNAFSPVYKSTSPSNGSRYKNSKVDKLFEDAVLENDMSKVGKLYQEMALILNDEVPHIYTGGSEAIDVINKRVKGYNVENVWWVDIVQNIELKQ